MGRWAIIGVAGIFTRKEDEKSPLTNIPQFSFTNFVLEYVTQYILEIMYQFEVTRWVRIVKNIRDSGSKEKDV